ncbi:PEP-CTERM sorting domain-containing protein [Aquincola sp. MAHUQ-54]|uniref:PEP-CTERM sorting domain-containing protein n=1 Tax=Aquincola agrisoli TaxID=3119538 RepID=A0AAW9QIA7_9BURK
MPMQHMLARWAAAAVLAAVAPLASAASTVLTFDALTEVDYLPAGYGGLDWSASTWTSFDGSGAAYAPHSGGTVVTLGWGATDADSLVRFGQAVTFEGAWFSGYTEGDVTFKLYYQGALVGTSATLAASATPSFLASGYAGLVDAVSISSTGHAFYAMDDFTFTTAVPEPETYALMLAGLGAVGLAARRRRA